MSSVFITEMGAVCVCGRKLSVKVGGKLTPCACGASLYVKRTKRTYQIFARNVRPDATPPKIVEIHRAPK